MVEIRMAQYRFLPLNPTKYAGDSRRIIARSKWELTYMTALDKSPLVLKWLSEPKNLNISYLNPLDKQVHQYWPDFLVQYTTGEIELIEIKPLKEAVQNEAVSLHDKLSLVKNIAKWTAAENFAKSIGAKFRVVTEKTLYRKKSTRSTTRSKSTRKARGTTR
jgi:hypothetical protein